MNLFDEFKFTTNIPEVKRVMPVSVQESLVCHYMGLNDRIEQNYLNKPVKLNNKEVGKIIKYERGKFYIEFVEDITDEEAMTLNNNLLLELSKFYQNTLTTAQENQRIINKHFQLAGSRIINPSGLKTT